MIKLYRKGLWYLDYFMCLIINTEKHLQNGRRESSKNPSLHKNNGNNNQIYSLIALETNQGHVTITDEKWLDFYKNRELYGILPCRSHSFFSAALWWPRTQQLCNNVSYEEQQPSRMKIKRTETRKYLFPKHNGIKLDTNNKRKFGKIPNE